jgi:catechol 2,3-dioxygenase-like lactoylglutathione lyase family enzyme
MTAVYDPARCIPTLASLDIEETRRFYVEQLGFRAERIGDYLIVKRDEMEIHFWLAKDRIFPENTSCYIRGGQVPALYEEYKARDVHRLSGFEVRSWNMKEFYIHDPHGNLLRFGCAPEEIEAHS